MYKSDHVTMRVVERRAPRVAQFYGDMWGFRRKREIEANPTSPEVAKRFDSKGQHGGALHATNDTSEVMETK